VTLVVFTWGKPCDRWKGVQGVFAQIPRIEVRDYLHCRAQQRVVDWIVPTERVADDAKVAHLGEVVLARHTSASGSEL
jgi:hypothetical protein